MTPPDLLAWRPIQSSDAIRVVDALVAAGFRTEDRRAGVPPGSEEAQVRRRNGMP
jgi:hypothetical protein